MKTLFLLAALILAAPLAGAGEGHGGPKPTNPTWEAMKKLVGRWESKEGKVRYEMASADTALVETLDMGKDAGMITVYTPEGDGILMTHYCAMGNQPRMRAPAADPKTGDIAFTLVDVSGKHEPGVPVMSALTLKPHGDALTADWVSVTAGKPGEHAVFEMTRVAAKKKKA
jgi:hypothetical protein